MAKGISFFAFGVLVGVVGAVLFERIREERGVDPERLAEHIQERLEALEISNLADRPGPAA